MNEPLKQLDYGQAVVFLEKAIAEKGADYEYERPEESETCLYFEQGQPSCIVGHVLSYMGYNHVTEGMGVMGVLRSLGIDADYQTQNLLMNVQTSQDGGMPWGDAVRCAQGLDQ